MQKQSHYMLTMSSITSIKKGHIWKKLYVAMQRWLLSHDSVRRRWLFVHHDASELMPERKLPAGVVALEQPY